MVNKYSYGTKQISSQLEVLYCINNVFKMRISQRVIRFFVLQTLLLSFDAFIFYDYILTFQKHATSKYGIKCSWTYYGTVIYRLICITSQVLIEKNKSKGEIKLFLSTRVTFLMKSLFMASNKLGKMEKDKSLDTRMHLEINTLLLCN